MASGARDVPPRGVFTEEPRKPGMKFEVRDWERDVGVGEESWRGSARRTRSGEPDGIHLRDGATAICLFYFSGQAGF